MDLNVNKRLQGVRHVIPISGKDSLVTAITQKARDPEIDYEYFFNETGAELPESSRWINQVSVYLGKRIKHIGANLEEIIEEQGILPSQQRRFCTPKAKIFPMENYLGKSKAILYLGLRADEMDRGGYQQRNGNFDITPRYPLQEMGITLPLVWRILEDRNLLPPAFFWEDIYNRTIIQLKHLNKELDFDAFELLASLRPWQKRALFAWRSRDNCFFCFNQRQYEFIGLLDYHPDMFWHAAAMERRIGAKNYNLLKGYPLRTLAKRAEKIKRARVDDIVKTIINLGQLSLFEDLDNRENLLSGTSCGLLCGK